MTENPEKSEANLWLDMHDRFDNLLIEAYPNGGYVVSVVGDDGVRSKALGAFTTKKEMLEALTK